MKRCQTWQKGFVKKWGMFFCLSSFIFFLLFGCGGKSSDDNYSGTGSGSALVTYDATGSWIVTIIPDPNSIETNTDECDLDDEVETTVEISQSGTTFTMVTEDGRTFSGTVSNADYKYTGSWTDEGVTFFVEGEFTLKSETSSEGQEIVRGEEGDLYCQWTQDFTMSINTGGGTSGVNSLEYLTSFTNENINLSYYCILEVSGNGDVFIFEPEMAFDLGSIHKFSSTFEYQGTLANVDGEIKGNNFMIDSNDRLLVHYSWLGVSNIYSVDGSPISSVNISDSENDFGVDAVDMDNQGNYYNVGVGSEDTGRLLYVWKVSNDFSTRLDTLEKNDLLQMLPGVPEEDEVVLNDIKVDATGNIYICVDLENDSDGVLILDNNMQKISYVGGNWLFNFPKALDFDDKGYVYVSSTYGNKVSIFDSQGKQIEEITASDIDGLSDHEDFLPEDICVKNGKLFVMNSNDHHVYVFNAM